MGETMGELLKCVLGNFLRANGPRYEEIDDRLVRELDFEFSSNREVPLMEPHRRVGVQVHVSLLLHW